MATNFPNINGDAEGSKPPPLGPIFIPIPNKSAAPRRVQAEPEAFTGALFVPSNLNQEVTNGDIYSRCTFGSGTRIGVDVVAGDKLTVINSEFGVDCIVGNNCTYRFPGTPSKKQFRLVLKTSFL
jgi:hypothetical protein